MQDVKIIKGAYGYRPAGTRRIQTALAGEVIAVPDAEAERLAGLGVAEILLPVASPTSEAVATPQEETFEGQPGVGPDAELIGGQADTQGGAALTLDSEQLKSMSNAKLRELAEDMGIPTAKLKNKAELIQALTAVQVIPGPEDESVEDGEQLPTLCAEAPVV